MNTDEVLTFPEKKRKLSPLDVEIIAQQEEMLRMIEDHGGPTAMIQIVVTALQNVCLDRKLSGAAKRFIAEFAKSVW